MDVINFCWMFANLTKDQNNFTLLLSIPRLYMFVIDQAISQYGCILAKVFFVVLLTKNSAK